MDKKHINSRVLTALMATLEAHKELTKTAFAQMLGVKPSTFTEILKSRMNVGSDLMALLTSKFGVNATWLLTGQGDMYQREAQSSGDPMVDRLLLMIDKKDAVIQQQAEELGQFREQVAQLRMRLEKSAQAVG